MMKSSTSGCSRKYWKASHDRTDINVPYLLDDNESLIIVWVFNSQTVPITCKIVIKILTTLRIKIHILMKTRHLYWYIIWDTNLYFALYNFHHRKKWMLTVHISGNLSYYDFSVEGIRRFQCGRACQLMNGVDGKCECPRD